jgi:tetratricopeptide (TPR) repeat protein
MSEEENGDLWGEDRDRTLPRQGADRRENDPEEFFKAGMFLLKRDRVKEAHAAFKQALFLQERDPRYMSYTGLTLAMAMGKTKEAVLLCEKAVQKEFFRAELFLNLGKVYLLAGNRKKAHIAFRKGMTLDRDNRTLRGELEKMGIRKPPVFKFLDRRHPVNKLTGKMLHRMRLR